MTLKQKIIALIAKRLGIQPSAIQLALPPSDDLGDIAVPCFTFAKELHKSPIEIASEYATKLTGGFIESAKPVGPYINIHLNHTMLFSEILKEKRVKKNKKSVVIDYSSPNIAKPFGVGHLRSTFIGESLKRIYATQGYKTIAINHIGDWGTQFGKLIVAYKKWPKNLSKQPIRTLYTLYVRFHEESEKNPPLEEEARLWFKKLEQGDKEALRLWNLFRALSIKEFKQLYKRLGCSFDSYDGEAFYNTQLHSVIQLLKRKKLLQRSEGADIIDLSAFDMPPGLICKSDGTSLYLTRDIAAALYRYTKYRFSKMLYEVGEEQQLHFKQLFSILELMGKPWADRCMHISHGLYRIEGKKMSTRKGTIMFVEDLIDEVTMAVMKIIKEKNPALANKLQVAEKIALSAIVFHDLKTDREHPVDFNIAHMTDFQGETGPYILYTYTRLKSIMRKTGLKKIPATQSLLKELGSEEHAVIIQLAYFTDILQETITFNKPDILAKYLIGLAKKTNAYYVHNRVIQDNRRTQAMRLRVISMVASTLRNGMELLGMPIIERM